MYPTKQPDDLCQLMNRDCWMRVFDYLEDDEVLVTLSAFKTPARYFSPSVYGTISRDWSEVPAKGVLHLMQAILLRPELASNIRHVSLLTRPENLFAEQWELDIQEAHAFPCCQRCGSDIGDIPCEIAPIEAWTQKSECYSKLIKQAQALVNRAQFPEASEWHEALELGNIYAYMALFLSQLPNLETLRLCYYFVWKGGFPGLMLKHALHSAPEGVLSSFKYLASVDYGGNVPRPEEVALVDADEDGFPECNPDQFMAWFHLPSVQSISIWLQKFEGVITQKNQGNLNNVHTLVLSRSFISDEDLPTLLSQTTSLKSLHLGKAYNWTIEKSLKSYPSILEGLSSVSNTLEKFSMTIEYQPYVGESQDFFLGYDDEHEYRDQFFGFLNRFSCLKSAEVPIGVLVGSDPTQIEEIRNLLPYTVEELCLQWDKTQTIGSWQTEYLLHDCITNILEIDDPPPLQRIAILRFTT